MKIKIPVQSPGKHLVKGSGLLTKATYRLLEVPRTTSWHRDLRNFWIRRADGVWWCMRSSGTSHVHSQAVNKSSNPTFLSKYYPVFGFLFVC